MRDNVWYMARSELNTQLLSDEARAEFLNFSYYLPAGRQVFFSTNKPNLKIWRTRKYTLTSIKQLTSYELYTLLPTVFYSSIIFFVATFVNSLIEFKYFLFGSVFCLILEFTSVKYWLISAMCSGSVK